MFPARGKFSPNTICEKPSASDIAGGPSEESAGQKGDEPSC